MYTALATLGLLVSSAVAVPARVSGPRHNKVALSARKTSGQPQRSLTRRAKGEVPLADFYAGTDLQWYGNITVGTPGQNITVVFDSGSSLLEFPSTKCGSSCAHQSQFDTSKSSTFVDGGRTTTLTFATGTGVTPVQGNEWQLHLRSGTDTVSLGGLTVKKTSLWTITSQTAAFEVNPFSGIMGMPADGSGWLSNLKTLGLDPLFAMYLTPNAVGDAELTLGSIDSEFEDKLTYASLPSGSGDTWYLASSAIAVNGKSPRALKAAREIIFDSGTSNVLFDTDTAEAVYALISPDIVPHGSDGTYGIACDAIKDLPAVIDITFKSTAGKSFNLTIPSEELSVGPFADDKKTCQTLINAYDGLNILGGSLLKHYYTVYNFGEQTMGFASTGF